jgi:hypothetical protein
MDSDLIQLSRPMRKLYLSRYYGEQRRTDSQAAL